MTETVFYIVLFAAIKSGKDKTSTTVLVTSSAAIFSVIALPFLVSPKAASFPFIVFSTVLHIGYFALIARTYRFTDMSRAYPMMRGAAPLLVALVGTGIPGETPTLSAWAGIGTICVGILVMTSMRAGRVRGGLYLSLCNAMVIAGYTLVDGVGVRLSQAPVSYTLWI